MLRAAVLALTLIGCADEPPIVPAGEHHTFVVVGEYTTYPTGLGLMLGLANNFTPVGLRRLQTDAIKHGRILHVVDLQTTAFKPGQAVGIQLFHGEDPDPTPCVDADDLTCGRHLDGSATLSLGSPLSLEPFVGRIDRIRNFTALEGTVSVDVALDVDNIITIPIEHATLTGHDLWAGYFRGSISGFVREELARETIVPTLHAMAQRALDASCTFTPPRCACTSNDLIAAQILYFVDRSPQDCTISDEELATFLRENVGSPAELYGGELAYPYVFSFDAMPATIRQ